MIGSALLSFATASLPASATDLLLSGYDTDTVHRFDLATLVEGPALGPVPGAQSVQYGPDGHLYAAAEKVGQILRFDGQSGAPLGLFVGDDPLTPEDESGGLQSPTGAVFGPDGDLYVGDFAGDRVLRYDGQSGAYLGDFVPAGLGGLNGPDAGLVFGPEGDLYVPSFESNRVLRYDGQSGAFLGTVLGPAQGLSRPRTIRFRDDGWLYVTSWGSNRVLRLAHGATTPEPFVTVTRPTGLEFEPGSGHLLVTSDQNGAVRRFSGVDGSLLQVLIPAASSPTSGATWIALLPDPRLLLERLDPGLAGTVNQLTVRQATPGGVLLLGVATAPASVPLGFCPGSYLGLAAPALVPAVADANGRFELQVSLGSALAGVDLWLQAFDVATCRTSAALVQTL
jgi:sugar lactone lactonase YvrE